MNKLTIILALSAFGSWRANAQTSKLGDVQLPTLFVIGDSTASNVEHRGWADPLADYFDLSKINRSA